jgi:hypothetical protein
MKIAHAAILLLGIACVTPYVWVTAADQPNEDAVRAFMRGKLDAAENVLEGLVTEDYELIEQGADQLNVMSQRAEWNVFTTPIYKQHSDDFQRAADRLGSAAKKQKLEAAALAYLQVTLACINCHKQLRGAKIADWEQRLRQPMLERDRVIVAANRTAPSTQAATDLQTEGVER